jgi:hypothetical protein
MAWAWFGIPQHRASIPTRCARTQNIATEISGSEGCSWSCKAMPIKVFCKSRYASSVESPVRLRFRRNLTTIRALLRVESWSRPGCSWRRIAARSSKISDILGGRSVCKTIYTFSHRDLPREGLHVGHARQIGQMIPKLFRGKRLRLSIGSSTLLKPLIDGRGLGQHWRSTWKYVRLVFGTDVDIRFTF